mmetsp:Transcript_37757/g.97855  ORF Transcript_37757/g.97855 Transcript_37757/m.97855 type:complete len:557 (-) Transcript_37757:157-1827(-)
MQNRFTMAMTEQSVASVPPRLPSAIVCFPKRELSSSSSSNQRSLGIDADLGVADADDDVDGRDERLCPPAGATGRQVGGGMAARGSRWNLDEHPPDTCPTASASSSSSSSSNCRQPSTEPVPAAAVAAAAAPGGTAVQAPRRADAAVQTPTQPGDILRETMEGESRIPFYLRKNCVFPIRRRGGCEAPYSVDAHFSRFDTDMSVVVESLQEDIAKVKTLADRYFGYSLAGVEVERKNERPTWRVPDMHVEQAALLAREVPTFRREILGFARAQLLVGLKKQPFVGRSLFQLASQEAEKKGGVEAAKQCSAQRPWARLLQVALDFAGRLMRAGALPRSFSVELIEAAAQLPITGPATCTAPAKGHPFLGLPAVVSVLVCGRSDPPLVRASSTPAQTTQASSEEPINVLLPKSWSEPIPGTFSNRPSNTRCRGTSLHLHDDRQPYCGISVNDEDVHHDLHQGPHPRRLRSHSSGLGSLPTRMSSTMDAFSLEDEAAAAAVHAAWTARQVADYWRYAAGGEHTKERLEELAREAEKDAWTCVVREPSPNYVAESLRSNP